MSEARNNQGYEHQPGASPEFAIVPEGTEHQGPPRPFFDPEALLPIQDVDISYFISRKNEDVVTRTFSRDLSRFVTETAEGPLADDEFNELFERTTGILLKGVIDKEDFESAKENARQDQSYMQLPIEPSDVADVILENFDALEQLTPRSMQLMDRFWNEPKWSQEYKVALRKLCLVLVILRTARDSGH